MAVSPRFSSLFASCALLTACGAVYPRYSTSVLDAPAGMAEGGELSPPPDFVQRISPLRAQIPGHTRDGRAWDADGPPDPYVRVLRNGHQVFRSPTVHDSLAPTWDPASVFADLKIRDTDAIRIELLDDDGVTSDPIGVADFHGVPTTARNGGEWVMHLENEVLLQMQSVAPPPKLGLGVTFEYHTDHLVVVDVEEASSAYTAGLRAGDRIDAIGGRAISAMNEGDARQGLDHGAIGEVTLTVRHGNSGPTEMVIRRDALYPAH